MKRIGLSAACAATLIWLVVPAAAQQQQQQEKQQQQQAPQSNSDTYRQLDLFGEVFERVRADYVEEVTDEQLIEAAINGMLSSLDPHSSYMNAKSFRDMQVQVRGEFGGLGIEVTMENGVVKVVSPIDDTPAAKAGLKPGDFITLSTASRCWACRSTTRSRRCAAPSTATSSSPSGARARSPSTSR